MFPRIFRRRSLLKTISTTVWKDGSPRVSLIFLAKILNSRETNRFYKKWMEE
jgi:hypothetical protein